MKRLISLLFLIPTIVLAEGETWLRKPVVCNTPEIAHKIVEKYNEQILLGAATTLPEYGSGKIVASASIILYINAETKSFTLIEYLSPEIACVISFGENLNLDPKDITEKRDKYINKPKGDYL